MNDYRNMIHEIAGKLPRKKGSLPAVSPLEKLKILALEVNSSNSVSEVNQLIKEEIKNILAIENLTEITIKLIQLENITKHISLVHSVTLISFDGLREELGGLFLRSMSMNENWQEEIFAKEAIRIALESIVYKNQ